MFRVKINKKILNKFDSFVALFPQIFQSLFLLTKAGNLIKWRGKELKFMGCFQ